MRLPQKFRRLGAALALVGALGLASNADAHAHVAGADPAPNGVATPGVRAITIRFSEAIVARFSGFAVTGPGGAKVLIEPPAVKPGSKALTAVLKGPLRPGLYKVAWHAVAADTHRSEGAYTFNVR